MLKSVRWVFTAPLVLVFSTVTVLILYIPCTVFNFPVASPCQFLLFIEKFISSFLLHSGLSTSYEHFLEEGLWARRAPSSFPISGV